MGIYHFNIKVKGIVDFYTSFDVRNFYDPEFPCPYGRATDLDDYTKFDSDGYLYINGYRTTNNRTVISDILRYINSSMKKCPGDYGSGGYIDLELHITYRDVVCLKSISSSGGIDRLAKGILHKIFG